MQPCPDSGAVARWLSHASVEKVVKARKHLRNIGIYLITEAARTSALDASSEGPIESPLKPRAVLDSCRGGEIWATLSLDDVARAIKAGQNQARIQILDKVIGDKAV